MLNATILSLNVMRIFSVSPYYSIEQIYSSPITTYFFHSAFSYFFSNAIISHTTCHMTHIGKCKFLNTLSTPVKFQSEPCPSNINNRTFYTSSNFSDSNVRRPYFANCGDLIIDSCIFRNCYSFGIGGGALFVTQDSIIVIHNTLFSFAHTDFSLGGGALISGKNFDVALPPHCVSLNVQYCCFSYCYPTVYPSVNVNNMGIFGSALLASSRVVILYFSSTSNCFNSNKNIPNQGAQLDLRSPKIMSQNANISGGNSKWCGSMEYRDTVQGFFKFQTIVEIQHCIHGLSFSDLEKGVDI